LECLVPPETILVLDIGTSGTKAVMFSNTGHLLAEASANYRTESPQPGRFEQSPDDWIAAAKTAISRLGDLHNVALLALTGTMQNVILLGMDNRPLFPALLYSDGRATPRFNIFNQRMQALDAAMRVGNQIDPLMCSAKLEWLRAESPQILAGVTMVHFGAKDYVGYQLTGQHGTDATAASTTGLMNLRSRTWDTDILAELSIAPDQLPPILPSGDILGNVSSEAAAQLGLRAGLPVLNGIGDAGAATIGARVESPNHAYVYLGTTGWVARTVRALYPRTLSSVYTLAHADPELLIEVAPILTAGDAIAWLQDICCEPQSDVQGDNISTPLYLPYLKGERSPFHDPHVRGAFLGLDRSHGPNHLRRAVLEGVALAIRHNLNALGQVEGTLMAIGGAVANRIWMQILANITGHPVALHPAPISATAYGAAILGARWLGWDFRGAATPSTVLSPDSGTAERASKLFRRYLMASDFLRAWAEL
jgi:xylulokinase